KQRTWLVDKIVNEGIAENQLPLLGESDKVAGYVGAFASRQTGFIEGTPVLCGVGDAGATTMGAGVVSSGDRYIYAGTTGWIATTTNRVEYGFDGLLLLARLSQVFIIDNTMTFIGCMLDW